MVKSNNYGFPIALALHLLILTIPVTMAVSRHFNEIELFVLDETPAAPVHKKERFQKPKEIPPAIVKEPLEPVKEEPEIIEPERKEIIIPTIQEPDIISTHSDVAPAISDQMPQPPKPLAVAVPQTLHNVEFGSQNGPRFLHREMPRYPIMARRLGKEGSVLLRLTIDEKGHLLDIETVESAVYGFTESAVVAVMRSTFMPAMIDGKAVMSKALLPVRFISRRTE